jgi:hypothetical protein
MPAMPVGRGEHHITIRHVDRSSAQSARRPYVWGARHTPWGVVSRTNFPWGVVLCLVWRVSRVSPATFPRGLCARGGGELVAGGRRERLYFYDVGAMM